MDRTKIDRNDRIRGSLIAGAIGDALGYPIEFERNIQERQVSKYIFDKGIISELWRETRAVLKGIAPPLKDTIYLSYLFKKSPEGL